MYNSSKQSCVNNSLIINSTSAGVDIALLEDKRLIELHRESAGNSFSVGDICLGKVKKLAPGLNAAFVNVGSKRDAFLHYLDLGPQVLSFNKYTKEAIEGTVSSLKLDTLKKQEDIKKEGKITSVLSQGQQILVQVSKEPISTKGPRISTEVTLAGRYLVLVPFSDKISVSSRVKSREEKERLKRLMASIKPAGFGVIVRTVAEDKKVAELDADLNNLIKKWESISVALRKSVAPKKVLGELSRTSAMLRDMLNASFQSIQVDDEKLYDEIKTYLQRIAPDKEKIVKLYKAGTPIFDHFGITKQIKASFGKHANMPSGAYLIIEHTEALHVIDVNSGNTAKADKNQEENALITNIEAAEEIARQLRLRDMGGIIVIDFIDLKVAENRKKVYDTLVSCMRSDKAKHNILPLTKFGLMQITRQRVRPELEVETGEVCPSCKGSGEVSPSILLVDEISAKLKNILKNIDPDSITLCVHPFLYAYLKRGVPSIQTKWFLQYKRRIKIRELPSLHFLEYKFIGKDEEDLDISIPAPAALEVEEVE